jgi:hypothetical protein
MTVEIVKEGSNGSGGGGNVVMGFILGAVMIVVAVVGFIMWDNFKGGGDSKPQAGISLTIKGK